MGIYIYNFVSIPLYAAFFKRIKNGKKYFFAIITLQLFLILALRADWMGVDMINYRPGFEYISKFSLEELISRLRLFRTAEIGYPYSYESGYVVCNWLVAKLGGSFHTFLVLHAAFCMISISRFIYKYSEKPWLSYMIFVSLGLYEYMFGILRQTLALCIVLYAISAIEKRKLVKFLIIVFVAFTIHRTAILFLPLYFIYELKWNKNDYIKWLIVSLGFATIAPIVFEKIVASILNAMGHISATYIDFKLNNMFLLVLLIVGAEYAMVDFKSYKYEKQKAFISKAFLLSIALEALGMCNDIFARSLQYYFIFAIILVPYILNEYKDKRVVMVSEGILTILLFLFYLYDFGDSMLVPYVSLL